jgi:hypothetical protein
VAKSVLDPQGKWDALRADLMELYEDTNESDSGFQAPQEYLLTKGTKV